MNLFDEAYYAFIYPQYRELTPFPLVHYLAQGWKKGFNPSPNFNTIFYQKEHPEAASDTISPLEHYLKIGREKGYRIFPELSENSRRPPWLEQHLEDIAYYQAYKTGLFDPSYYMEHNPDVRETMPAISHFREHGWKENRNPSALMDLDWYRRTYLDGDRSINPLLHVLQKGQGNYTHLPKLEELEKEAREQGLFDEKYYIFAYPELAGSDANLFAHYVLKGWQEGRNPSPVFNTARYLEAHPELEENPLIHLLLHSQESGLDARNRTASSEDHPGQEEHKWTSIAYLAHETGLFDEEWYVENNPEVRLSGYSPIEHFRTIGAAAGLDPGPGFNSFWYAQEYGVTEKEALHHYLTSGRKNGHSPAPDSAIENLKAENRLLISSLHAAQMTLEKQARELLELRKVMNPDGIEAPEDLQQELESLRATNDALMQELGKKREREVVLMELIKRKQAGGCGESLTG